MAFLGTGKTLQSTAKQGFAKRRSRCIGHRPSRAAMWDTTCGSPRRARGREASILQPPHGKLGLAGNDGDRSAGGWAAHGFGLVVAKAA